MLLIPPCINWFNSNSIDILPAEKIFAAACYKNVAIFKLSESPDEPPNVIKLISHHGRVISIALYPFEHSYFGHTACILAENSNLSLVNIDSKAYLSQHYSQKANLLSICWAMLDNEDVVVAVGENGQMIIWQPQFLVAHNLEIAEKKAFTLVSVVPHCRSEVLVVAHETILHIQIKDGSILNRFKGHDKEIYTIKWCPLDMNPFSVNTRWKEEDSKQETERFAGPFFATTDLKRNLLVWDFELRRYIVKTIATGTGISRKNIKDKSKSQHIDVSWANNCLFSTSTYGELVYYDLASRDVRPKVIAHPHDKVIYNMEAFGNVLVTFSFDRLICGFDVASNKVAFSLATMNACANTMAFSPHDANRLALGYQDCSISVITFKSKSLNCQRFSNRIQGRVIALAWHPENETKILFGTSDGQVGLLDISSGNTTTFSHFHQKAVYKVEWGPAFSADGTQNIDAHFPYSFGDYEILMRNPSNEIEDPVKVRDLLKLEKSSLTAITEFSFSFDLKYFAIGFTDGSIKVFDIHTNLLVIIANIRKTIQHILWKPPISADSPYILSVGSAETSIFIYNLDDILRKPESDHPITINQATKELCGHLQRVVWLSWSPHNSSLLASASYDHTAQIWDVDKGEALVNYGGHSHRVFRVEFSPLDPDLVISFAEENCIHQWRISKMTSRNPTETTNLKKTLKPKTRNCTKGTTLEHRKKAKSREPTTTNSNSEVDSTKNQELPDRDPAMMNLPETTEISVKVLANRGLKKPQKTSKALFTDFHNLNSRKKSFHQLCIMSLMHKKLQESSIHATSNSVHSPLGEDDDLDEDLLTSESMQNEPLPAKTMSTKEIIQESLIKYKKILGSDGTMPTIEEVHAFLEFFGDLSDMNQILSREIEAHEKKENILYSNMIHSMKGSLSDRIKWAAKHKKLDAFLVSMAPQVSFSLWEYACESFAQQLIESGDILQGASYLISVHKIEEAIEHLAKNKFYKEAFAIAKCRLPFQPEVIDKIISYWSRQSIVEGNFETVALLYLSIGDFENAARAMGRRTEPGALTVSALLYAGAKCNDLALSTAVLALKDCCLRNEFDKLELLLENFPQLKWFKVVHLCLITILGLGKSTNEVTGKNMLTLSRDPNVSHTNAKQNIFRHLPCNHPFRYLVQLWEENGISSDQYLEISLHIKQTFTDWQLPSSAKQLWFLTSISLCQMVIEMSILELRQDDEAQRESSPIWESYLSRLLNFFENYSKYDQPYFLTHALFPSGPRDSRIFEKDPGSANSPTIKGFKILYILSEFGYMYDKIDGNPSWLPWKEAEETNSEIQEEEKTTESIKVPNSFIEPEKDQMVGSSPELIIEEHSLNEVQDSLSIDDNIKCIIDQTESLALQDSSSIVEAGPKFARSQSQLPSIDFILYETREEFFDQFKHLLQHLIELLGNNREESSEDAAKTELFSDPKGLTNKIIDEINRRSKIEESLLNQITSLIN